MKKRKSTRSGNVRVAIFQEVVPNYRLPFFAKLSELQSLDVNIFASSPPPELGLNLKYHQIGPLRSLPIFGMTWLDFSWCQKLRDFDVVVLPGAPRNIWSLLLTLKCRLLGVPVLWWGHLWSATTKKLNFFIRLWLMRLATGAIFYTHEESRRFKELNFKEDYLVSFLNNGIDDFEIKTNRKKYIPKERKKFILFIGRLTEKSNIEILVEAVNLIQCDDIKVKVIGGAPSEKEVTAITETLLSSNKVEWLGPLYSEQEIADVANTCRLFCYPGAVGLSIIHAMHYGLPTVVHDRRASHMPEISATNDATSITFIADDQRDLARVISENIDDIDRLEGMSAAALLAVEDNYTTSKMAFRMETIIQTAAGTKKRIESEA